MGDTSGRLAEVSEGKAQAPKKKIAWLFCTFIMGREEIRCNEIIMAN
jgi:hypothetical protein